MCLGKRLLIDENPWKRLISKDGEYFAPEDEQQLRRFNDLYRSEDYRLRLEVLPEPFMGSPNAPVWILNLNPGFDPRDSSHPEVTKNAQRANLVFESPEFWYLSAEHAGTAGYEWWNVRLKSLIEQLGRELVSKNLFCLEVFPYHSKKYKPLPKSLGATLPTQAFTAKVLQAGIASKKCFILFRGKRYWTNLTSDFSDCAYERINNPRYVSISPRNCPNYEKICEVIKASKEIHRHVQG